ncbi:MAG: hypothetical protein II942_00085 [Alphaproteobacteria bacterium]|nr:hypothetical protein [Alphaproteobacteria bacterium]
MVKKVSKKGKMVARIAAIAALFQTGCASMPVAHKDKQSVQVTAEQVAVQNMTTEEEEHFRKFFADYAKKSPTAQKVLTELYQQNASVALFDKEPDENNIFDAGLSNEDEVGLNRRMEELGVPLGNTFFHEAEHVLHLKQAHTNGINAASFKSLDDVYVYCTIMEGLAERKAKMVCVEYDYGPWFSEAAKERAEAVFNERIKTTCRDFEERLAYEKAAVILANSETNTLPNQRYFERNPNWDEIISIMSRGEVRHLDVVPQPTLPFLHLCILKELEKNPNAMSLDEFDLSCALAHRSVLQQNEADIRETISDVLMQTYAACENTGTPLQQDTLYSFLYLIGWPTAAQQALIDREEKTFDEVRAENLAAIPIPELLDGAVNLIQSEDVQAYQIYETRYYGKMFYFEKQILCPAPQTQTRNRVHTR